MKRFFAWMTLLCLVFCLAACTQDVPEDTTTAPSDTTAAPEETTAATTVPVETTEPVVIDNDLLNQALDKGGHVERLVDMPNQAYGEGYFEDYMTLHANPLQAAEYPMVMSAPAHQISADATGLTDFIKHVQQSYGTEMESSWTIAAALDEALEQLFAAAGTTEGLDTAKASAAAVSSSVVPAMTEYLSAIAHAQTLNKEAVAKIPAEKFDRFVDFTYCPPATSEIVAKLAYIAQFDADQDMLRASGLIVIEATEALSAAVSNLTDLTVTGESLTIDTPFGAIILGTFEDDAYTDPNAMLIVEPGGNDTYDGKVAVSLAYDKPIGVVIDLAGDDIYTADDADGATQGSGLMGTGVLFDLAGNDIYTASRLAQGSGLIGTGVLFDGSGTDIYTANVSCQSAANYGFAALVDISGDDSYHAVAYAQASAGNKAMAFLVDSDGNDTYYVEPYVVEGYERAYYSQYPLTNGNWSQGCGVGNRAITSSAFTTGISGGIAGLIDLKGSDTYTGGIWVMGAGYWSGIGYLLDTDGNDVYHSLYYSQGSSAHYGIGILQDVGGDDVHKLQKAEGLEDDCGEGASIGFVWDRGIGMLINDGGNDSYSGYRTYCGVAWSTADKNGIDAQEQTYAFFIDTAGDDSYGGASTNISFGYGFGGFFIDAEGTDQYTGTYTGITDGGAPTENADNCGGISIDYNPTGEKIPAFLAFERAKEAFFSE